MGLVEQVMAFLRKLFSSGSSQPASNEVELNQLFVWLNQQEEPAWNEFESLATDHFSRIRFLLVEISHQAGAISSQTVADEKGNARLRKVVSSSQQSMLPRLKSLVVKLEPPKALLRSTILDYSRRAHPLLQSEINSTGKNIAYTGLLLKDEMKEMGKYFSELETLTRELFEKTKEPVFVLSQNALQNADELSKLLKTKTDDEQTMADLTQNVSQLFAKLKKTKSELTELSGSDDAREVARLQTEFDLILEQQAELQARFVNIVGKADKPLRRFFGLVANSQWSLQANAKSFFERFQAASWNAILSDPKGALFKEILGETKLAIEQQKITAKDNDERQKWLNAIEDLRTFDFFSEFFWKQNQLTLQKQKIEKQLSSHPLSKKQSDLQKKSDELSRELSAEKTALEQAQGRLNKTGELVSKAKEKLEEQLGEIAEKPVTITF